MWSQSASHCWTRLKCSVKITRWARQVQSASYLHNPGSEPLTIATLGDVIAQTAEKYPGRVAVKSLHERISITYEELLTQADSLGCALRDQGLVKGDRLGLWSHNNVAWIVTLVAAARAGLVSVLLNPAYEKTEISFCIRKTQLKSLFIGETLKKNYYGTLEEIIPEMHSCKPGQIKSQEFPSLTSIINAGNNKLDGTFEYSSLIKDYRNNSEISKYGSEVKPEEGCLIHLTSGTTGEPKAALDSHIGVVNNAYFCGIRNELNQGHQNICVQVPLFHALGSVITSLSALRHGSSMVLAAPTYNVKANVDALLSQNCSVIMGTPTMHVDMIGELVRRGDVCPEALRVALAAGAPCSPHLIKRMKEHMNVHSVKALYGLTETTAGLFHSLPGDSTELVADTVGYIVDHIEAKTYMPLAIYLINILSENSVDIFHQNLPKVMEMAQLVIEVVDEKGDMVPFGSPGELMARGYNNMICYWDEPEKTRQVIDKDGWVRTGDKFILTEDGYGRIVGRLKDIIVRGGENIAPKEIEDILNTHPDIIESQVVGVSDERLGEELCAVLRMRDGADALSLSDITKHCASHIARYKMPRIIKVIDEFPKTTSGKIQKFKVLELIETGKL